MAITRLRARDGRCFGPLSVTNPLNELLSHVLINTYLVFSHADSFVLCERSSEEESVHEMYSFSNALAMSVKLAHWEHSLERLIQSLETLPEELMVGRQISYQSSKAVLQKFGEVFLIR